jgi:type I restriction enzyme S subunit
MNTKQLRQKILDLAIRGKLVPQDPNDEPASVLLERIRTEKERLIKAGKIKRSKNDSVIVHGVDKSHYEQLPQGWARSRLIDLYNFIDYRGVTPQKTLLGVPLVTAKNVKTGYIDYTIDEYISRESYNDRKGRGISKKGDILFTTEAPLGNVAIADLDEYSAGQRIITLQDYHENQQLNNKLFMLFLLSTFFQEQLREKQTGTTVFGIKAEKLKRLLLPVPPLAEEQRIVDVIESAFAMIDEIERNKTNLQAIIAAAKSKILSLAICGKLVPQDSADEPADALLERIRTERESLIKQRKIKRNKSENVAPISVDNSYYAELPESWAIGRIGEVFIVNPRNIVVDSDAVSFIPMTLIDDGFSNHFTFQERPWREVKSGFTHFQEGDVGLAKITPCLENRKSVVFRGLINGVGAGTTELHIFRPICENSVEPEYLLWFMKNEHFISECIRAFSGAVGQQRVSKDFVAAATIPIPPLAEQRRIVAAIEAAFEQLDNITSTLT